MEIDIVIDSLTNCLICSETGEEFDTEFKEITVDSDLAQKLQKLITISDEKPLETPVVIEK